MKHFIAIHRFHNDEKRKGYCMSPGRKDPPEAKRMVKEWADFAYAIRIQKQNVVHNGMVMKSHSVIGKQKVPRIFLTGLMKLVLRTICPLNSMNSGGFIPTMTNLTKSWFIRTTREFDELE